MRHRNKNHRLGRKPDQARLMLKNLLTSILLYERIRTTRKRAKVLRPLVDRVVAIGKNDRKDLAIRRINQWVTHGNACRKVIEVLVDRYRKRPSGFTSIRPVGMRKGDGACLVDMTLIDSTVANVSSEKKPRNPKSPTKPRKSSASLASSVSSASST